MKRFYPQPYVRQGGSATQLSLLPQEKELETGKKKRKLFIGIPKESSFQENRVPLTPESVSLLINNGHRVLMETGAAEKAGFSDNNYSEVGGEIIYDKREVFNATTILKVAPPTLQEMEWLNHDQIIFSPIHLPTMKPKDLQKLMSRKVTAIAYEYIKDNYGIFPMVRALSEIAGCASILIAAEYLSSNNGGTGILAGGVTSVPPTKVVILGAGAVGENATRTALGLGAEVRVFDNNIYKLMRLRNNVNVPVYTSVINPEALEKELAEADIAVGAIHSESGRTPCVVSEQMVSKMKAGSVIIDVSIDQGGCFETSRITNHDKPTFEEYDVIHYCVPNIASRYAKTASTVLSHVTVPILIDIPLYGSLEGLLKNNHGLRHGVYLYKGRLTNQHLSQQFDVRYTNLDLLMTASF